MTWSQPPKVSHDRGQHKKTRISADEMGHESLLDVLKPETLVEEKGNFGETAVTRRDPSRTDSPNSSEWPPQFLPSLRFGSDDPIIPRFRTFSEERALANQERALEKLFGRHSK